MLPFEYCHAALETASMGLKKKAKKALAFNDREGF
jgi:hypothetical protein